VYPFLFSALMVAIICNVGNTESRQRNSIMALSCFYDHDNHHCFLTWFFSASHPPQIAYNILFVSRQFQVSTFS